MPPACLLGIDIGTSGAKAVVTARDGRLLAAAGREYAIQSPRPGWAEQDPEDWLAAALACARQALQESGVRGDQVAGIGLAGQMHSLVCLDERGRPLRPAILWADQRSGPQARALSERIGRERLAAWAGNPLAAGFMLASWAWLRENEPDTAAKTRLLMLPKDYTRLRLTGAAGAEPSDASSTLLFDPHQGRWSAPLLAETGLREEQLPPLSPSARVAGGLLPEMADSIGLPAGTPVVMGASDVSAQALAQGVTTPGMVSCTIGTGGQLFAPLAAPNHDPGLRLHLFCHCLPDTWHLEAAILSAGLALRWLRDQVFTGRDYAALASAAGEVEAGLDGLFFLPFLAGERTPYMDAGLRAGFLGLGLRHGQAHMIRAVMEGVVFALRQGLELMQSLGAPLERLAASGGATRHPLWLQLQADIFNRPVYTAEAEEATARGAALLAGIGAGVYADAADAIRAGVREPRLAAQPDPARAERYAAAFQEYTRWAEMVAAERE